MGTARLTLEPPDSERGQVAPVATETEAVALGAVPQAVGTAGVLPSPPWLTYAPEPWTHTHIRMSKNSCTSDKEL